ncbi:MAG: BPL-N domain-containing protein [Candidatus Thorarchaeota archaeon]
MDKHVFIITLLLSSIFLPGSAQISSFTQSNEMVTSADMSEVKVAIFNGSTTVISAACKNATASMFEWMGSAVDYIDEDDIMDNKLCNYDILVFPPGDLPEYSVKLRSEGKEKIREYLRNGGSFVGISRGAHFACEIADVYGIEAEYGLNLFNGTGYGPVGGFLEQNMYQANINKSQTAIDLSEIPDSLTMMGWETIMFLPENNVPLNVIASYETYGNPAMISYGYGQGTVFLSGIHPEFEEDDDRDNTSYFDHHTDPESDWPLMLKVSEWLVDTSTWDNASINAILSPDTSTTDTDTTNTNLDVSTLPMPIETIALIGGIGAVVVVIVTVGLFRRKS